MKKLKIIFSYVIKRTWYVGNTTSVMGNYVLHMKFYDWRAHISEWHCTDLNYSICADALCKCINEEVKKCNGCIVGQNVHMLKKL